MRIRVGVAALAVGGLAVMAGPALLAQAEPGAPVPDGAGYRYAVSGMATGMGFSYDRVGLLAFSPIVDVGFPRSRAGIDSSPSGSAQSAPGDLGLLNAANAAPSALGLPSGIVPAYPLLASSNYPTGPAEMRVGYQQSMPDAPQAFLRGLSGRTTSELDRSSARAELLSVESPGPPAQAAQTPLAPSAEGGRLATAVFRALRGAGLHPRPAEEAAPALQVAAGSTSVDVNRDGLRLVGSAVSRIEGLSLFGGLVTADVLNSSVRLRWDRPGEEPGVEQASGISGLRVMGLPVAEVGPKGVVFARSAEVPLPVQDTVNRLFGGSGLKLASAVATRDAGGAGIVALAADFDGSLTPEIPGALGPEHDIAHLAFGSSVLRYFSALDQVAGGSDGLAGSAPTGSGSSADLSQPVSGADGGSGGTVEAGGRENSAEGSLQVPGEFDAAGPEAISPGPAGGVDPYGSPAPAGAESPPSIAPEAGAGAAPSQDVIPGQLAVGSRAIPLDGGHGFGSAMGVAIATAALAFGVLLLGRFRLLYR